MEEGPPCQYGSVWQNRPVAGGRGGRRRGRAARGAEEGVVLAAADWERAALAALAEGGLRAVAVEPLARRLGVTKGSFYWHFRDRAALLAAALARWEREETESVIADAAALDHPGERLRRVFERAFPERPPRRPSLLLAVSDAAAHPPVARSLRRVARRRLAYLETCYRELGLPAGAARHRALLAYAAYLGTLRLAREARDRLPRGAAFAAFRRHVLETLATGTGGPRRTIRRRAGR